MAQEQIPEDLLKQLRLASGHCTDYAQAIAEHNRIGANLQRKFEEHQAVFHHYIKRVEEELGLVAGDRVDVQDGIVIRAVDGEDAP